jgi:site-specific recombinase XerD
MAASQSFSELITDFIEALRIDRGASEKTVEAYKQDLNLFGVWLGPQKIKTIESSDLHKYFTDLTKQGQKATSIARKTSTLRQFFKFCCLEKGFEKNPLRRSDFRSISRRSRFKNFSIRSITGFFIMFRKRSLSRFRLAMRPWSI